MSDETREASIYEVAYLLWQVDQGYVTAEDRAVSPHNWMLDAPSGTHPDDRDSIPHWLDLAREVIALVAPRVDGDVREALANAIYERTGWEHPRGPHDAMLAADTVLSSGLIVPVGRRSDPSRGWPHRIDLDGEPVSEVDRIGRLLMKAYESAEGRPVGVTYVATFADMARAVVADRTSALDTTPRA